MIIMRTNVDIDMEPIFETMRDDERIEWIKAIVENIKDEGTIDKIRHIVNDSLLDD